MLIRELLNVTEEVSGLVLYSLIALSVLSLGIAVERLIYFTRRKVDATALGKAMAARLRAHDRDGALKVFQGSRSVEAAVLREALPWAERGAESVREVLEGTLREKKKEYERGLLYLGTVGNNAPFVGLFGTVLGIVSAFRELASATAAQSGQMGNVMGGIAEALVATAVGILVAIPAVVSYNYFSKRAGEIEDNVATLANYLLAELKGAQAVTLAKAGNGAVATEHETPISTSTAI